MTVVGRLPALNGNHTVTPQHHVLKAVFPRLPVRLRWTMSEVTKTKTLWSLKWGEYIFIWMTIAVVSFSLVLYTVTKPLIIHKEKWHMLLFMLIIFSVTHRSHISFSEIRRQSASFESCLCLDPLSSEIFLSCRSDPCRTKGKLIPFCSRKYSWQFQHRVSTLLVRGKSVSVYVV